MSNIAGSSVYSSANTSTSTLRPRGNRLISYLDEASSEIDTSAQAASTSTSTSRGGSPSAAQSRSRNVTQAVARPSRQTQNHPTNETAPRRSSSLWAPWSSIQGAASSLLGNGESSTSASSKGSVKTPAWMKQDSKFRSGTSTAKWGPEGNETSASKSSTLEDHQAIVQAKKREALLLSCAQEGRDELGHFKRKISYDAASNNSPHASRGDADTLAYKHRVQQQDTMAGVTIKYSCQPEAFRKMNRFWPNDNIQTRAYVLLPVNACSARGRKLDDANSLELLTKQLNDLNIGQEEGLVVSTAQQNPSTGDSSVAASPKGKSLSAEDFEHDSYVILSSFPEPVEIVRVPHNTIGYFPRARRKSSHQPVDPLSSTPKTSFDMLRHPPTHAAQQAAAALAFNSAQPEPSYSLSPSPVRRPALASRQRSSSTAAATNTGPTNAWFLRGPGGVGTLKGLRTEISRPGPAEDPLNQKFAHYFPGLAIQPDSVESSNSYTSSNYLQPRSRTNTMSRSPYRLTPRASIDSVRSTRSNSSTFGVESLMRKFGGKRPDLMPRTSSGNLVNAMGLPIGGDTGLGDLIELETTPDGLMLEEQQHQHQQHSGRGRGPGQEQEYGSDDDNDDNDVTPIAEAGASREDMLNQRFPVRGRITRAYAGDDG